MKKEFCPAYGKKCLKCKSMNHFAKKYQTKNIQLIERDHEDNDCNEYYIQ